TLDGCQLLGYVRTRKIDNDFYRMERLQLIMKNMFDKLKKKNTFDLIVKNDENLKGLLKNVYTNMSDNEIISLLKVIKECKIEETLTVPINYETRTISTGNTVFSSDYAEDVRKMHEILYNDDSYELTDTALEVTDIHNMYIGK
ncbi:MAG: hypothetical protein K6G26_10445, partial [Lachnospiraceae bacterium]|nr:hypothetical protein [Lachnospiraceae bacterium]